MYRRIRFCWLAIASRFVAQAYMKGFMTSIRVEVEQPAHLQKELGPYTYNQ